MNLLPVRISELTIGQPLLWDQLNQDQKQLHIQDKILIVPMENYCMNLSYSAVKKKKKQHQ